ncbi:MAG: D-alanyl-D-alanine carboxypeptidase/D-alanyl-D-alanine-endopeptidase, partial [Elainellaceae cyanobacterium]
MEPTRIIQRPALREQRSGRLGTVAGIGLALSMLPGPALAQPSRRLCPVQLGGTLEAIAAQSLGEQARWGALVQPVLEGAPALYARSPQQYFTPASNVKLLTSAAALAALGPDFRIVTSVHVSDDALGEGRPEAGAAADGVDLWVAGRGDPSFDDDDLQQLARQVRRSGISRVRHLIGDERYLGDRFVNPTWDWEDVQSGYGAPVNSLILNQNAIGVRLFPQAVGQPLRLEWEQPALADRWQVINESTTVAASAPEFVRVGREWSAPVLRVQGQLRVGSARDRSAVAVTDPATHFLEQFELALVAAGVAVDETVAQASAGTFSLDQQSGPKSPEEVARTVSPPLSELLIATNADSQNLYAEALLRHLGRAASPDVRGAAALWNAGLVQVETTLSALGITGAYQLADGSGLSRRNLVTPEALVQTLQAMAQHPHAAAYQASLAVAGERGTLRSRFRDTPVAGRFWGKSGGLTGVSSLSGYLEPPGYAPL